MVKAQSSVEFMLLLSAIVAVSIIALSGASSQLQTARNFTENATEALEFSSSMLLSNLSAGSANPYPPGGGNESYPELSLELYAPTLYAGQPSVIQVVVWNYGGTSADISRLAIAVSDPTNLPLAPSAEMAVHVGLSHTMTSIATPKVQGSYTVSAAAYGSDGELLRSSDGSLLQKNITILVLSGNPDEKPSLNYTIALERSDECVDYGIVDMNETVYGAYWDSRSYDGCFDFSTSGGFCGINVTSWIWKCGYELTGYLTTDARCLYKNSTATTAAFINSNPQYTYSIAVRITNATGANVLGMLNQNIFQTNLSGEGSAQFNAQVSGNGPNPSIDGIVLKAKRQTAWALKSRTAYEDYRNALSTFEAFAASCRGSTSNSCWNSYSMQTYLENSKADAFIASSPPSAAMCTATLNIVRCNGTSLVYPTLVLKLNSSFLGGHIRSDDPDRRTISGITVEVSTD